MTRKWRITGWDSLYNCMSELGITPDSDSISSIGEWYYTLDEQTYNAVYGLLLDRPWIDYRSSEVYS